MFSPAVPLKLILGEEKKKKEKIKELKIIEFPAAKHAITIYIH